MFKNRDKSCSAVRLYIKGRVYIPPSEVAIIRNYSFVDSTGARQNLSCMK